MARRRTSIIIADDNDMMRSILRGMLRGEEYDVVGEARNGQSAIEMADRLKPDIVCMDVMMPEKNGIEALCEIKVAHPTIEVVMVTSNSDPGTVQESIQNGASGFIIKPFNAARVLDTLEKVSARIRQAKSQKVFRQPRMALKISDFRLTAACCKPASITVGSLQRRKGFVAFSSPSKDGTLGKPAARCAATFATRACKAILSGSTASAKRRFISVYSWAQ